MIPELSPGEIGRLRDALDSLRTADPARFSSVFLREGEWTRGDHPGVATALDVVAGLGFANRTEGAGIRPRYMVRYVMGRWMVTDFPWRPQPDSVFPLYPESEYFVRHMHVPDGARALDLCTGSGIYAIFAAERAKHIVAVDINPRALALARVNLALNCVEGRVELRQGDLFSPVAGERFDYISANPPFEPVPPGLTYYLHSDGGPDGLCVVRRLLAGSASHLSNDAVLEMVAFSLGGEGRLLLGETIPVPPTTDGRIWVIAVPEPFLRFAQRFDCFGGTARDAWVLECLTAGMTQIYLLFVRCLSRGHSWDNHRGWEVLPVPDQVQSYWLEPTL